MTADSPPPRLRRAEALAILLLFLAVALVYTAPLAAHLTTALPHHYGAVPQRADDVSFHSDTLQLFFCHWHFKDSLLTWRSPWVNHYEFAFPGTTYHIYLYGFPLNLAFLPLSILGGDILAYNLLVLFSFPLAALPMYALIRERGGSRGAALAAATLWACAPWRVGKAVAGHHLGFLFFLPPLFLLFFERALRQRSRRAALGAGVVLLVIGMTLESYLNFYFLLFLALYLPCRFILSSPRANLRQLAPVAIGALAQASYLYFVFYRPAVLPHYGAARTPAEIQRYSARLDSFTWRGNPDAETALYLGLAGVAALLTPLVLLAVRRRFRDAAVLESGWLVLVALAGMAMSLAFEVDRLAGLSIYRTLIRLPFLAAARVPTHAFLMTLGAAALLVASLVDALPSRVRRLGGLALVVVMLLDFRVSKGVWLMPDLDVYLNDPVLVHQRNLPEPRKLLFLPALVNGVAAVELNAVTARTPSLNGFGPLLPGAWVDLAKELQYLNHGGALSAEHYRQLGDLGVTHVLVDPATLRHDHFPADTVRQALRASPYLVEDLASERLWLFALESSPRPKGTSPPPFAEAPALAAAERSGRIEVSALPPWIPAETFTRLSARVRNLSTANWPGEDAPGDRPVRIGVFWTRLDDPSAARTGETRIVLATGLSPGEETRVEASVFTPSDPGRYRLTVSLLQESVAWFPDPIQVEVEVSH